MYGRWRRRRRLLNLDYDRWGATGGARPWERHARPASRHRWPRLPDAGRRHGLWGIATGGPDSAASVTPEKLSPLPNIPTSQWRGVSGWQTAEKLALAWERLRGPRCQTRSQAPASELIRHHVAGKTNGTVQPATGC